MTPVVRSPDAAAVAEAGRLLREGRLIAFPTETVYGLGADAGNDRAVAAIFAAKGRPQFNPLIVHVGHLAEAEALAVFPPLARQLAAAFWPGPLTLVIERRASSGLSHLVSAGLDTVALRVPDHAVARGLLTAAGRPIAAPSANRSSHVSATLAAHVAEDLGSAVAMILDGGPTPHGLESTIVAVTGNDLAVLRPGAVTSEAIEAALGLAIGRPAAVTGGVRPAAPGQLESHYAPKSRVRLNATEVRAGEALLAFGLPLPTPGPMINLSPRADTIEAAATLFAALRALDAGRPSAIAVMPIPTAGLGEAINDRLRRAASGRSG